MADLSPQPSSVLWWSRSGRDYSRNRVIRQAFLSLGWQIRDFQARLGFLGDAEAAIRRLPQPDIVWVPCFRQRELSAAARFARRRGVPLVFDPLISAWDKQVHERGKLHAASAAAERLRRRESALLQRCDLIIADTSCHADYFRDSFAVAANRLAVIPVGAEEFLFRPRPMPVRSERCRVLFYGSFIGLQGPQVIAAAARDVPEADWTFVGDGPLRARCESLTESLPHVSFADWVPYESLPDHIAAADIVLGVFGGSGKAGRVIPNKVYQALACGRPVVTRPSDAYPKDLRDGETAASGLLWCPPDDAGMLAASVRALIRDRENLPRLGEAARCTFEKHFSAAAVTATLQQALRKVTGT